MPTTSDTARLRQIAIELKALYGRYNENTFPPFDPSDEVGVSRLLREAITLGAFPEDAWAELRADHSCEFSQYHTSGQAAARILEDQGKPVSYPAIYAVIVAEVEAAAGLTDDPDEDGPVPPDSFRHGDKVYSPIAKRPFLALTLAWPSDGRSLHKDVLADALGERADTIGDHAMQSIRGQLQAFFRLNELPYRATVSGLYLAIHDAPPEPPDSKPKSKAKRRRAP